MSLNPPIMPKQSSALLALCLIVHDCCTHCPHALAVLPSFERNVGQMIQKLNFTCLCTWSWCMPEMMQYVRTVPILDKFSRFLAWKIHVIDSYHVLESARVLRLYERVSCQRPTRAFNVATRVRGFLSNILFLSCWPGPHSWLRLWLFRLCMHACVAR